MSIKLALADLVTTIDAIDWVSEVRLEEVEKMAKAYRVTVLAGDTRNTYQTGRLLKREFDFSVIFEVNGANSQTDNVLDKAQALEDRINEDPRRGGYAQTTTTPGWEVEEQGRTGTRLQQTITIYTNERL